MSAPTLPAYLRLPDGLRLSGTVAVDGAGVLNFAPKQALSMVPPAGLPVDVVVAGLPDDDEGQVRVPGSIDTANARLITLDPDDPLPATLLACLAPGGSAAPVNATASPQQAAGARPEGIFEEVCADGIDRMGKSMRRFLVDLGDHLFDLATSARYGSAGRHRHYDALNQLKRASIDLIQDFQDRLRDTLNNPLKDQQERTFADLEGTSAQSLGLVAVEEVEQKLAIEKIVTSVLDKHRIALECLTIRTAMLRNVDAQRARTPFHPAHVINAFLSSLEAVTSDAEVNKDIIGFFGQRFTRELDSLYPALNGALIAAGIEPDLEQRIEKTGSILHPPPEKRIVKSAPPEVEEEPDPAQAPPSRAQARVAARAAPPEEGAPSEAAAGGGSGEPAARARAGAGAGAAQKHDAIYDAVLAALDSQRTRASADALAGAPAPGDVAGGEPSAAPSAEGRAVAPSPGAMAGAGTAAAGDALAADAGAAPRQILGQEQVLASLRNLRDVAPEGAPLDQLPPLNELLRDSADAGDGAVELNPDSANRLNFVDNVFRTLQRNFEVSEDMAPSLARLRVPLARLSLQEPKFFTQPAHPAHRMLDKLSTLASSDHTISRSLQKKVEEIVDRIAENYDTDSSVFDEAQQELDALVGQKNTLLDKNIERVISALRGQERLWQAQRRVEEAINEHVDADAMPTPLQQLLDNGWRGALIQLLLREGEDSRAWQEEIALLDALQSSISRADRGELADIDQREVQLRLRALNKRLAAFQPGASDHEPALRQLGALIAGKSALETQPYHPPEMVTPPPAERVEQLPRLRRWLKRATALEPGARLRYRDKQGNRRQMRLVWVSEDRNRFAFVNERGQKIAELTAIQLARQLSRGATPPTSVDRMSVLDQSMYNTLEDAQKTLSFDRNRDRVTRLINSESLLFQLQRSLRHAQQRDAEHAFMLLGIDNFALVNEVFDTPSGDEVLREFARLLGQLNDRRALTARMQGDEFGILLTYRSLDEAQAVAEKIRTDIADSSLRVGEEAVSFTVSVGIAPVIQTSDSVDSVVEQASEALALAKTQGRNQVVIYNPDQREILEYTRAKAASRRQLDEAMSTDQLVLRAQPIVQTSVDGSQPATHHYEILLAMRDEKGGLGSPQDFISSAERFGFITLVDQWVVREVFAWISSLVDRQKVVPELSINLSGTSITDNDFLDYILEQISEFGVGTSRLCFEITETGAIDNLPRAADFVRTLKNIGCKFSLDDFGTGLASHNYLRELPVDYVKIDGTFITNIHTDSTDYAMAKSINDLAHFLGQETVAECVETLDSLPALRDIGIDYLQGWGIGMPLELDEISEALASLET